MQLYWAHTFGVGDENGIAWFGTGSGGNGDAIAGGGYAAVSVAGLPPAETNGDSARPHFPIVASFPVWDSNYGQWSWRIGFAVPEGQGVTAHIWVTA
jgi:hypothetical protein